MKSIDMEYVFLFVELQCQLTLAFVGLYPDVKDLRWLLDFPKSGVVVVDSDQWQFVRHGAGLRFVRLTCEPHMVVDIHKYFGKPKIFDDWRLLQFFESCGKRVDKNQISSLLSEMHSKGYLFEQSSGQYLLVGQLDIAKELTKENELSKGHALESKECSGNQL